MSGIKTILVQNYNDFKTYMASFPLKGTMYQNTAGNGNFTALFLSNDLSAVVELALQASKPTTFDTDFPVSVIVATAVSTNTPDVTV